MLAPDASDREFEGREVRVADAVLYVDGGKVMDFPDPALRL